MPNPVPAPPNFVGQLSFRLQQLERRLVNVERLTGSQWALLTRRTDDLEESGSSSSAVNGLSDKVDSLIGRIDFLDREIADLKQKVDGKASNG